ncbi:MAG: 7-carboxy-7-deazaguanine synthase QueE, partial [Oscillospiraceae bacterium]|nr:7-carboxy-7-deazaguanine synthase QueE [Oscillospiraceae bacterium]
VIKFVIGSQEDLEKALFIIEKYQLLERCKVYFSPVYNKIQPAEIVNFMKKNNLNQVKLQLQLHKYIWNPEKKGV